MKIALLGKGKTGSKVAELTPVTIFNSQNIPTYEKLSGHDALISFLPGEAFLNYLPLLLETGIPVITGSTGFTWPHNFDGELKNKKISWVYGTNFSMGVVMIKHMLQTLSRMKNLFPASQASLHEIHHTRKLDAPSGTALSMKEWFGDCEITSERTGDVIGFHELTLDSGSEVIKLSHEAKDRRLFAEGALWAAQYIVKNPLPGLHSFQSIVERGAL